LKRAKLFFAALPSEVRKVYDLPQLFGRSPIIKNPIIGGAEPPPHIRRLSRSGLANHSPYLDNDRIDAQSRKDEKEIVDDKNVTIFGMQS
jgi:hypothetical protein